MWLYEGKDRFDEIPSTYMARQDRSGFLDSKPDWIPQTCRKVLQGRNGALQKACSIVRWVGISKPSHEHRLQHEFPLPGSNAFPERVCKSSKRTAELQEGLAVQPHVSSCAFAPSSWGLHPGCRALRNGNGQSSGGARRERRFLCEVNKTYSKSTLEDWHSKDWSSLLYAWRCEKSPGTIWSEPITSPQGRNSFQADNRIYKFGNITLQIQDDGSLCQTVWLWKSKVSFCF